MRYELNEERTSILHKHVASLMMCHFAISEECQACRTFLDLVHTTGASRQLTLAAKSAAEKIENELSDTDDEINLQILAAARFTSAMAWSENLDGAEQRKAVGLNVKSGSVWNPENRRWEIGSRQGVSNTGVSTWKPVEKIDFSEVVAAAWGRVLKFRAQTEVEV